MGFETGLVISIDTLSGIVSYNTSSLWRSQPLAWLLYIQIYDIYSNPLLLSGLDPVKFPVCVVKSPGVLSDGTLPSIYSIIRYAAPGVYSGNSCPARSIW